MYFVCHKNNLTIENELKYKIPRAASFCSYFSVIHTTRNRTSCTSYFIFRCIFSSLIVVMTWAAVCVYQIHLSDCEHKHYYTVYDILSENILGI